MNKRTSNEPTDTLQLSNPSLIEIPTLRFSHEYDPFSDGTSPISIPMKTSKHRELKFKGQKLRVFDKKSIFHRQSIIE
jgi:hypothetical protein